MSDGYRIADEPSPGALSQVAVNPLWPLLAVMLGGTWIAWPWFALNSFAFGSTTKLRELLWVGGGFLGSAAMVFGILSAVAGGGLDTEGLLFRYILVGLVVWKLWISYRLYLMQARTFQIYEYFDGVARSGWIPMLLAFYVSPKVLGALPGIFNLILR